MSRYTRFPSDQPSDRGATAPAGNRFARASAAAVAAGPAPSDSREAPTDRKTARPTARAVGNNKVPLLLFLITLVIPIQFFLGPLQLTPNRLVLLALFVPLVVKWARGDVGKIYGLDYVFMGYVFWMGVTMLVAHGAQALEGIGMTTVETVGAFLVGRMLVRTPEDFRRLQKVLFLILLALVPAAVLESFTGFRLYSEIADAIANTHNWVYGNGKTQKRWGMFRAQSIFEHPILFGTFSAALFGLLYFSWRPNGKGIAGYRRAVFSMAGTFFSLSSGAIISIVAQVGMATWDTMMKKVPKHWFLLIGLSITAFIVVDLLSNRTPFEVFISYATFSVNNGYIRIVIFNYGMDNVWANPIFGLGQNDWVRPVWLRAPSVDNFWLLMAMRHGIPGFLLIFIAFFGTIIRLSGLKIMDPELAAMRKGIVFSLIGLSMSLVTVHVWGVMYVFVCFLLGAGVWLRDYVPEHDQIAPDDDAEPEGDTTRSRRSANRGRG